MKYLNKKIIAILCTTIFLLCFIFLVPTLNIKTITYKDIFSSQTINKIDHNIKNNLYLKDWIIKIKNKYQKYTLTKESNNTYIGKDNYLLKRYKNSLKENEITKDLNTFQSNINYINMNLILSPSATTIYKNKLPAFAYNDSEINTIENIYKGIVFNKINIINILNDNTKNYQLFYKTDTNWTVYGAYYAYYEYAIQNNITPIDLTSFDIETVSTSFAGNLYKNIEYTRNLDKMHMFYLNNSSYTVNDNNTLYDISKLNSDYMYEYYLGNIKDFLEITNNNINSNKELVIVGDTLSHSMIPFLINHYKKIYYINPNTYDGSISEYIKNNPSITDCIILFNINNLTNEEIKNIY